ncbi:SVEP1-like protein, partial [Mya arenaria]
MYSGSIDGMTHFITYTAKDSYGRTDSCSFSFKIYSAPNRTSTTIPRSPHALTETTKKAFASLDVSWDNDPPLVTCLRQVFYAERGMLSTHVYWEEPTVTDNVDIDIVATKLSTDINQGDALSQGTYEVSYRATDKQGNWKKCSVVLEVKVIRCDHSPADALSDPKFLTYNCTDLSYYYGVQCDIRCELNLDRNGSSFMTCEKEENINVGAWKWESDFEPHCIVVSCPPLSPPANGAMTFDTINARPMYVMACEMGLEVPNVGNEFTGRLSCQDDGDWFPLDEFPDCIEPSFLTMALPAELYYEGNCNDDATKELIKNTILGYLASIQADIESSLCPGESCSVDNLEVICGESRKRRETFHQRNKRQVGFALVRFNIGAVFNTTNRDVNEAYNRLLPMLQMIENRITIDVAAGSLDITGFVLAVDAFVVSTAVEKVCPKGYIIDGFICKACPAGTYFNASSETCELCPIGQYIEMSGMSECDTCPSDHSTMKTGSKMLSNCTRLCEPGFVSGTTMVPCTACPKGTFQPEKGQTTCAQCPPGTTTSSGNAISLSMCQPYDIQLTPFIGRHEISQWSSQNETAVLVLSFWGQLVYGFTPNASFA